LLPKRGIRQQFILQLFVASATLLLLFSTLLYSYITQSIIEEKKIELTQLASNITHNTKLNSNVVNGSDSILNISVEMKTLQDNSKSVYFTQKYKNQHYYLAIYYIYKQNSHQYIKITKNITTIKTMLQKIYHSIIMINLVFLILIIFYAIYLSKMLVRPIKQLSDKISGINEKFITPIDISTLPEEFLPLGETLNNLITRLTTFITYQKELFIGTAHELKTPLAVMKLKNEVTLIKKREIEVYINAMKHNNQTINQMNKTIGDILNIGRQESAQFEPPIKMDVIQYLNKIGSDFKLLAQSQNKNLLIELEPKSFNVVIQKTLLNQIIQNFLQNALKFTPEQNTITVKSYLNYYGLKIEIYDEGIGVDENVDLFAPFKRVGNQQGVGLGLFLAKSAADALDAKISIKNRLLSKGTIASLEIKTNLTCILPKL